MKGKILTHSSSINTDFKNAIALAIDILGISSKEYVVIINVKVKKNIQSIDASINIFDSKDSLGD